MTVGVSGAWYSARISSSCRMAARLSSASRAGVWPRRWAQSRLARQVADSRMSPTPNRRAIPAYLRKYFRSAASPSDRPSRAYAAKSGSASPSWKIRVVSTPPSVRNRSPPSCGKALRYPATSPSLGSRVVMADDLSALPAETWSDHTLEGLHLGLWHLVASGQIVSREQEHLFDSGRNRRGVPVPGSRSGRRLRDARGRGGGLRACDPTTSRRVAR